MKGQKTKMKFNDLNRCYVYWQQWFLILSCRDLMTQNEEFKIFKNFIKTQRYLLYN